RRYLVRRGLLERDEHLDDACALDLLDRHAEFRSLGALGPARDAPEKVEHPPADRFVRLARDAEPGGRVEIVDRELAGDAEGGGVHALDEPLGLVELDRKSTRLNSS